ncbi:hypothetical protein [endosymbiont GvMRE of Glomus versiforme]|uniref:hypothetical protein n=1 Tax=endosymbiont GvMRE of Glomus versiforme TaxID=2039283 RepID=UPI000ED3C8B8|nr:hypothetical protein [endosymbiont GvMRE of Glomus versiforme]RHZ35972.1 hypothetical protein GvMRE_Ic3g43 [endosymbiont GvMRE of Glomus versiforme]
MGKEENQQGEELKKKKLAFEEIRDKFNSWRFNMYLCLGLYVVFFILIRGIDSLLKEKMSSWLSAKEYWVVAIAATVLGICFIADSIVTSYLKTPLQRLALKIDDSPMKDKQKSEMMRLTQETNELFKETLKKFGILVIPLIIYNVIDSPTTYKIVDINNNESKKWKIEKIEGQKRSEWLLFYICYLIPVLFATWRVVQFIQKLNKIEKKILNEQKKHLSN